MASKTLVRKLDTVFSKFIRLRDSKQGAFQCVSCRKYKPYSQADCGHFVNRRFMALRWAEKNCHAQCRSCNRFSEGAGSEYTLFMIDTYGREYVDYLNSYKNEVVKYSDFELEQLIKDYTKRVKDYENMGRPNI